MSRLTDLVLAVAFMIVTMAAVLAFTLLAMDVARKAVAELEQK